MFIETLTSEEKKKLDKRGFFVKEIISFIDLISNLPSQIFAIAVFSLIWIVISWLIISFWRMEENIILITTILTPIPVYFLIIKSLLWYIVLWKKFYKNDGTVLLSYNGNLNWTKNNKDKDLVQSIRWFYFVSNNIIRRSDAKDVQGLYLFIFIFLTGIMSWNNEISKGIWFNLAKEYIFPILLILIWVYGLSYIFRQLVEHLHPLYAFWNLGEKIQKLTPDIESQSQIIQNEFKKDINFVTLHSGFEELSNTFNTIIALVLKLERIEARANKWNLFDSEKYINSLRTDITEPLTSLKEFLMKQRQELIESQRELSRVRIWWSEGSGNRDLTSKRDESIIAELDTNIGALETMIQKMNQ